MSVRSGPHSKKCKDGKTEILISYYGDDESIDIDLWDKQVHRNKLTVNFTVDQAECLRVLLNELFNTTLNNHLTEEK